MTARDTAMAITLMIAVAFGVAARGGRPREQAASNKDVRAKGKTAGSRTMNQTCEAAREAIEARRFTGWRGLPAGCTPDALFGVALDNQWGELTLGENFEPARSRLLDVGGYYRPMTYVRGGSVVMFDGMNPTLADGWAGLSDSLGRPEATLDWVHGTVDMSGGELVYASRGVTVFLNPENDYVIHISVYVPTTVEEYIKRLRLNREKRPLPRKG